MKDVLDDSCRSCWFSYTSVQHASRAFMPGGSASKAGQQRAVYVQSNE